MSDKKKTTTGTTATANSGCLHRIVRKCGKCKHGGKHFKLPKLGTHLHCCHPDESISGEPGWDSLREWYATCDHFDPNKQLSGALRPLEPIVVPLKETDMNCRICGRQDARIRLCELKTARITKRAHVDCNGHSEYRSVTVAEIDLASDCEAYKLNAEADPQKRSEV